MQLVDFASRHLPPGHEAVQFLQPDTYKRFMHHIEPVERILRQILSEGIKLGEFATIDPETTIPMVLACIGAERGPIAGKEHTVDEATDRVADFLLRALTPASQNGEVAAGSPKQSAKPKAKKPR